MADLAESAVEADDLLQAEALPDNNGHAMIEFVAHGVLLSVVAVAGNLPPRNFNSLEKPKFSRFLSLRLFLLFLSQR